MERTSATQARSGGNRLPNDTHEVSGGALRLDSLLDRTPPKDAEAEQLFLSAALVANVKDRMQMVHSLAAEDFYDAWHRWLFLAMRAHQRDDGKDLLIALQREPKPEWIAKSFGWWLASMLVTRNLTSVCGEVKHWRMYRDRIKKRSQQRKELDGAFERIALLCAEVEATS